MMQNAGRIVFRIRDDLRGDRGALGLRGTALARQEIASCRRLRRFHPPQRWGGCHTPRGKRACQGYVGLRREGLEARPVRNGLRLASRDFGNGQIAAKGFNDRRCGG